MRMIINVMRWKSSYLLIGCRGESMLKSYPAIFHKEDDGRFWVEFHGGTQGDSLEESMKNAKEMLESVLALYIDEGKELPTPTDINTLTVENRFVSMILADPTPFIRNNKVIRKNVTVPEWLVRLADHQSINYSEVLTQAIQNQLKV